jgi:hypothetical protein
VIQPLRVDLLNLVIVHELSIFLLFMNLDLRTHIIRNVLRSGFYRMLVRNALVSLKKCKSHVDLLPPSGMVRSSERLNRHNPAHV